MQTIDYQLHTYDVKSGITKTLISESLDFQARLEVQRKVIKKIYKKGLKPRIVLDQVLSYHNGKAIILTIVNVNDRVH